MHVYVFWVIYTNMRCCGFGASLNLLLTSNLFYQDCERGRPDPECYLYCASRMGRIPQRCVVVGNSNANIEGAQDARMRSIAIASTHPVYELSAADTIVRDCSELSVINLKQLFSQEEYVEPTSPEDWEHEEEPEFDDYDDSWMEDYGEYGDDMERRGNITDSYIDY